MKISITLFILFLSKIIFAQSITPSPERISKHINYLASDKMKGRGTGSKENAKAAGYVARQFKKMKLKPLGTDGYYQSFTAKIRRVVV